jgi:D-arginine dehydrogenase
MDTDFIVVGGGAAGAAAAAALAARGKVLLLEAEPQAGYHSTGRSAALFTPNYGNAAVRALIAAGRPFFEHPPAWIGRPLLAWRGGVGIAGPDQAERFGALLALGAADRSIIEIDPADAVRRVPVLRRDPIAFAYHEPAVADIDVAALHQGLLARLRSAGGTIACDAPVIGLERRGSLWEVATPAGRHRAPVVVNAAGAWADRVAGLAGLPGIGLVPKRRTMIVVPLPAGLDTAGWPAVDQIDNDAYLKPETGRLLASPGDATPCEPCDVQPEELDVAIVADWLQRATTLPVARIEGRWAGLRSFVADDTPVVGPDPAAEGFFWLAGQGGYGIMLAPVLGEAIAALATGGALPAAVTAQGLDDAALGVARLR